MESVRMMAGTGIEIDNFSVSTIHGPEFEGEDGTLFGLYCLARCQVEDITSVVRDMERYLEVD